MLGDRGLGQGQYDSLPVPGLCLGWRGLACSGSGAAEGSRREVAYLYSTCTCLCFDLCFVLWVVPWKLRNTTVHMSGSSEPADCRRRVRDLLDSGHCRRTFRSNSCFSAPAPSNHSTETNFVVTMTVNALYPCQSCNTSEGSVTLVL